MANTPAIEIADNENGTATVTITGSSAGSTNLLRSQRVDLHQKTNTWIDHTSRLSDGTINVTLDNGFYYFHVESSLAGQSAVSVPARSRVSDGVEDIYTRCLKAAQSTTQELTLVGVPDDRVHLRTVPQDSAGLEFPCVFIFPFGSEVFSAGAGTNKRDEVTYPVMIAFLKAGNQRTENSPAREAYLASRQKISDAFRNQRLAGVPECTMVTLAYRDVIDKSAWLDHNLFAGGIILNNRIWQPRGLM